MKISSFIENEIKYTTIECVGPLGYNDAKCFIYDNKEKCIIFYMENDTSYLSNILTITKVEIFLNRKEYYENSILHRDSGPAVTYYDKSMNKRAEEYWLNGRKYKLEKYNITLRKYKIRKLNSL